ncbi:MAG: hypothetical protein IKC87_04660 [Clostridia bacterium]|nr:hypothetical protein [Clostridia bacterium]
MKRILSLLMVVSILLSTLLFVSCQPTEEPDNENQPIRTVVELNENNYWKYFEISFDSNNVHAGGDGTFGYKIMGVLDYALYEDAVFTFDVIYYTEGQTDDQYQSYTMRIGCNAAGDAVFETTHLGMTNVTVGKYLGIDGELVSFENYNWKIHFKSVTGKVIYIA